MSVLEPTFSYDNHLGTVRVYRNAFPKAENGQRSWFERVRGCIPWKRNSIHGHHDRMIWDGTKVKQKDRPEIIDRIGEKIRTVLGIETVGPENFANHYKDCHNRTFWHRDADLNPGETVVMVSFGATRTLTFVDYRTDQAYPVDLGDRDIVVFDFNWNLNTFHAVEKTSKIAGERISLQFFHVRDESKWTRKQLKEWKDTESLKRQGVSRRRNKVKKSHAAKVSVAAIGRKRRVNAKDDNPSSLKRIK